jgi:CheY-like chemotaxis protein
MAPRILVVEDDRYFAGILRDYLGYLGLEVEAAGDGLAGWEAFQDAAPDIVLTDVLLPRLDGLELASRIKGSTRAEVPVVLMSAVYKDDAAIQRSLRLCGANDYLVKPFSMPDLQAVVSRLVPSLDGSAASLEQSNPELAVVKFRPDEGLPRAGQIRSGFLATLMLKIQRAGHTGVLELHDESRWKKIVFLNGRPVWADGDASKDRMGTMLLEEGSIGQEQFAAAVAAMRNRDIDFGTALVDEKILSPGQLYQQLRALVLRRIVGAFAWTVGEWSLTSAFPRQTTSFEVAPLAVIWRGLRVHGDVGQMQGELTLHEHRFVVPTARFSTDWRQLKNEEGISFLGTFLSGGRTVSQLRQMEILTDRGLARALWMLYQAGLIAFSDESVDTEDPADQTIVGGPVTFEGPDVSGGLTSQGEIVIRDYLRFWQMDFFAIFGVRADSSEAAIKAAVSRDPLNWIPSAISDDLPSDLRRKASQLWEWVEEGRRTLKDPETRRQYSERVQEGLTGVYRKVSKAGQMEATMFFEMGKGFLKTKDFREAELSFAKAVERTPDVAEYIAYQGWAVYRRDSGSDGAFSSARMLLTRSLSVDGHLPIAHYFLGVMHRDKKNYPEAVDSFEAATRFDPMFVAAQKALDQTRELARSAL